MGLTVLTAKFIVMIALLPSSCFTLFSECSERDFLVDKAEKNEDSHSSMVEPSPTFPCMKRKGGEGGIVLK